VTFAVKYSLKNAVLDKDGEADRGKLETKGIDQNSETRYFLLGSAIQELIPHMC
jgi:hypothetical protein